MKSYRDILKGYLSYSLIRAGIHTDGENAAIITVDVGAVDRVTFWHTPDWSPKSVTYDEDGNPTFHYETGESGYIFGSYDAKPGIIYEDLGMFEVVQSSPMVRRNYYDLYWIRCDKREGGVIGG